jgi:hypothetical protein
LNLCVNLNFQPLPAKRELVQVLNVGDAHGISIDAGAICAIEVVNANAVASAFNPGVTPRYIRTV